MNKGRSWARSSNSFHGVFDDQSELVIAYGSREDWKDMELGETKQYGWFGTPFFCGWWSSSL